MSVIKYKKTLFARFARKKGGKWFVFASKARKNEPLTLLLMRAKRATEGRFTFYKNTLYLKTFKINSFMKTGIKIFTLIVLASLMSCREGDIIYTDTQLGQDLTATYNTGGNTSGTFQPLVKCATINAADFPKEDNAPGRYVLNGKILTPDGKPAEKYPILLVYNTAKVVNGQMASSFEFGPYAESDKNGLFKFDVPTRTDITDAYIAFDGYGTLRQTQHIGPLYGCNDDNYLVANKSRNLLVTTYEATDINIKAIDEGKSDSISILGMIPSIKGIPSLTGFSMVSSKEMTDYFKSSFSKTRTIVFRGLRGKDYSFNVTRIKNGVKTEDFITIRAVGNEVVKEILY
jgi:hypothetical protein